MPTISVVIPSWNRAQLLHSALANLRAQTLPPEQIVVVDNGSTDDTAPVAVRHGAELIRFSENRGFAAAVNAGIGRARGEGILILNNDVVLPPDWLAILSATAEAENADYAVGKLLCYDDPARIDGTWDLLSRGAHAWRCGFARTDGPAWSERRAIDFAPMTAALFHRSVFQRVGLLDETFEAYYEDVDFGLRCALAGLRGVYEPRAVARHMGKNTLGKYSERVALLTARNQIFLLAKHYPGETLRKWCWAILTGQTLSLVGAAQNGQLLAALKGIWQAVRRWSALRGSPAEAVRIEPILARCEAEIRSLQRQLGCDPYWRLYFSLVRTG